MISPFKSENSLVAGRRKKQNSSVWSFFNLPIHLRCAMLKFTSSELLEKDTNSIH